MTHSICPHCGYDLNRNEPIVDGDFRFDPDGDFSWRGVAIAIAPKMREIIWSLIKARPRFLSNGVIGDRCDIESAHEVSVYISKIRQRLRAVGVPDPIVMGWKQGYRWQAPLQTGAPA